MRLGRGRCGKPLAFRLLQEILAPMPHQRQSLKPLRLQPGKPEAFRKESGQAASNHSASSRYLLVVRQSGRLCVKKDNRKTVIPPDLTNLTLLHPVLIMKLITYSLLLLCFCVSAAVAQKPDDDQTSNDISSITRSRTIETRLTYTPQEDPLAALKTGRVIFVESSLLLVGTSVIEEKLQKRPEFKQLGLAITRHYESADIILQLHHDVFTKYVYTAIDRRTDFLLASGKLSSLGGTVAGKVAERFLKQVAKARLSP